MIPSGVYVVFDTNQDKVMDFWFVKDKKIQFCLDKETIPISWYTTASYVRDTNIPRDDRPIHYFVPSENAPRYYYIGLLGES